jgi:hypothetical protein
VHEFLRAFSTGGAARRARLKVPASLRWLHSHGAPSRFARGKRTVAGTASAFRSDAWLGVAYAQFLGDAPFFREASPMRVRRTVGGMAPVPFTGPAPRSGRSSRLRRGEPQKRVVWGLTKR